MKSRLVVLDPFWRKILLSQTFEIRDSPNVLVSWSKLSVFDCTAAIRFKMLYLRWSCIIPSEAEIGLAGRVCITLIVPINIQGQYTAFNVKIAGVAN